MTPEAQRIAIAEACTPLDTSLLNVCRCGDSMDRHGYDHSPVPLMSLDDLPDYLTDLNAMHEAVMARDTDEKWAIFATLANIVPAELPSACGTAAQWAEAFLKTLDLWDDTK